MKRILLEAADMAAFLLPIAALTLLLAAGGWT